MHRLISYAIALVSAVSLTLVATPADAAPAAGQDWVKKAQRRLADLHCDPGPVDGKLGLWTRSAVVRFQTRHGMAVTGKLTRPTKKRLYSDNAKRCDRRPVPAKSGKGRRIVVSQYQNWVWLVGPKGGIVAQGGMVDNPAEVSKGRYATGSYCGRAGRIRRNSDGGSLWLHHFVRYAPCGFGFHRIPTYKSNGAQIHADWLLGTNYKQSHGCIRLSRGFALRLWNFTTHRTRVRVK